MSFAKRKKARKPRKRTLRAARALTQQPKTRKP